jgi:hypothetical protein
VNDNLNVRLSISRCRAFRRINSWRLQLGTPWNPDVTILARLAPGNDKILDYFCVPASKRVISQITISPATPPTDEVEQFENLDFLQDLAEWGRRR